MTNEASPTSPGSADLPGVPGELHGRATRRIATAHCWLEFLALGGPRIVGFGLAGGQNVLAETPDSKWDGKYGEFELVGGHRLWFAPESPECSFPDVTGLHVEAIAGGVRLTGGFETPTGIRKSIEIKLAAGTASAHLHHTIRNAGEKTLELAPWPVTQLRLGGIARVGLPGFNRNSGPTQLIVMWPYSSWADDRLCIRDGELSVAGTPGDPFKVGCLNVSGRVSYEVDDLRFVKTYDPALGRVHTDLGCNLQIYVDGGTIELESLGPLTTLAPGEAVDWDEVWELTSTR
jgi:hypothetical protein